MLAGTFFMLGVIHRDREGPALLQYWLDRMRPDVITLELSHYGIRFRRELGEGYKERIGRIVAKRTKRGELCDDEAFASLLSYVSIPYEYDCASSYAVEHKTPLYLIDMDFFSYVKLRAIEDLVCEENVDMMLEGGRGPNDNQEIALARLYFDKGIIVSQHDREMQVRDKYMSTIITDLMNRQPDRIFLHVCGWRHLQDPSNLYSQLKPIKVFSHDKTLCL